MLACIRNMTNAQRLKILTDSGKTVFSSKNLRSLWNISPNNAKIVSKRMVEKGLIMRIAKGYYALNKDFNINELASLIISPSYVSFNTALFYWGVSFQTSNIISSVSPLNYQKKIEGRIFRYYAMKKSLFFNLEGINYKNNLAIARPERAVLDSFYFGLLPNIDNFDKLNQSYLKKLSFFYPKTVQKKCYRLLSKSTPI